MMIVWVQNQWNDLNWTSKIRNDGVSAAIVESQRTQMNPRKSKTFEAFGHDSDMTRSKYNICFRVGRQHTFGPMEEGTGGMNIREMYVGQHFVSHPSSG